MLWPMVIVVPLGNPVRLAEDLALIDQFSQGRVVFSVGSHDDLYGFLADFLCYLEPPASCQLGRITTGGQIFQTVLNNRLERL